MTKVINDLLDYNLKIVQDGNYFKFSLDSVLLAEFVELDKANKIVDFCTGNAAIPLILSTKTLAKIYGIEYQKEIFEQAEASIKLNKLTKQIKVIKEDVKNLININDIKNPDIITCNPPYFKYNKNSLINANIIKTIARHEYLINLEQIFEQASNLLQAKKTFYLVHRANRLDEIILLGEKYNLQVKKVCLVYTKNEKEPLLILVKAVKNGKKGIKINTIWIENYVSYKDIFRK